VREREAPRGAPTRQSAPRWPADVPRTRRRIRSGRTAQESSRRHRNASRLSAAEVQGLSRRIPPDTSQRVRRGHTDLVNRATAGLGLFSSPARHVASHTATFPAQRTDLRGKSRSGRRQRLVHRSAAGKDVRALRGGESVRAQTARPLYRLRPGRGRPTSWLRGTTTTPRRRCHRARRGAKWLQEWVVPVVGGDPTWSLRDLTGVANDHIGGSDAVLPVCRGNRRGVPMAMRFS